MLLSFLLVFQGVDESSSAYQIGKYSVFVLAGIILLVVLFFMRPKGKK